MHEWELVARALLVGLAGWRVASLLVQEEGPFDIFSRLRALAGHSDTEATLDPEHWLRRFFYTLLGCVWCTSVWVIPAMWVLFEVSPTAAGIFAAMTVAVTVQQYVSRA